VIARYPRYAELWDRFQSTGAAPERAESYFQPQDFTDLQVLSQLAWFDEFFLREPEIAALVGKGRSYSPADQHLVIGRQRELISKVLPALSRAIAVTDAR
jgi:alpha-amylase/alpha-mannosidase (GH57 family)